MNYVICLEDRDGMAFNHRRLSKDQALMDDLMYYLNGRKIYADEYSSALFEEYGYRCETVENPVEACGQDEYVFLELTDPADLPLGDEYVIYRWNRTYPADTYCSLDLRQAGLQLISAIQFEGKSHPEIDREVWREDFEQ